MVDKSSVVTKEMIAQFKDPDEPILFKASFNKISRWGFGQQRTLAVTTEHFYLFD